MIIFGFVLIIFSVNHIVPRLKCSYKTSKIANSIFILAIAFHQREVSAIFCGGHKVYGCDVNSSVLNTAARSSCIICKNVLELVPMTVLAFTTRL